ncbi:hypothetical protein F4805DRAFT_309228 [Annulohypoxylon moriforme]|nr:hypothetical protein F4805DRAFT_309228 [Annulohypoxylon moriforme]
MTDSTSPPMNPPDQEMLDVPLGPGGRDPSTTLPRILNFLADEDQYRHMQWAKRIKLIKKYLQEAQKARKNGDLGYDTPHIRAMLDDAIILVDVHQRTYDWNNGPTPWSIEPLPGQPTSTRLPTFSDHFLKANPDKSRYKRRRIDYPPPNEQKRLPGGGVASPFAGTSRAGTRVVDLFLADEERFFENPLDPQGSASGRVNLFKLDNDRYEQCIKGGIKETLKRAPWRPAKDIPELWNLPTSSSDDVPDNLQEFSIARGWQRAAIQHCLNIFSNHENRVVNTPWRRVILPFREPAPMPKDLVYYPRALAPEKVPHSLKDPYPFVHQYSKYEELTNVLSSWMRRRYIRDNMGNFQRSALPHNFTGPFVYNGLSVYDDHWLRVGSYLKRLHVLLQDAFGMAPRPFMVSILRDIQAGMQYRPGPGMDAKYIRKDIMKRPGADVVDERENPAGPDSHGPLELLLLDEADAAWLRFLCEPSRTPRMCDPDQQPQDNLAILFDNRIQNFLNDPNASGSPGITGAGDVFLPDIATWEKYRNKFHPTLRQALAYINGSGSVDANETYQFSRAEAEKLLRRVASYGRCNFIPAKGGKDTTIVRPFYELHPEHRISWRHEDRNVFKADSAAYRQTILEHLTVGYRLDKPNIPADQFLYLLDHVGDPDLANLLSEATQSENASQAIKDVLASRIHDELVVTRGSYPENGRGTTRQEPSWSDLISWEHLGRLRRRKTAPLPVPERTVQFYRNLAYRMGRTIAHAEAIERRLRISGYTTKSGKKQGPYRWKAISKDAFGNDLEYWQKSIQYGTGEIEFKPPTIDGVIEKADPHREFQKQYKDQSRYDILREGMINDCVLNRNTLYPSRETVIEDKSDYNMDDILREPEPDRIFQGVKRPSLWKWATDAQRRYQAPFTRYAFFSMMRWPIAHQHGAWKNFLESRQDEVQRINPRLPEQEYGILAPRIPGKPKGVNSQNYGRRGQGTKNTTSDQGTKGPKITKDVGRKNLRRTKPNDNTKPTEETTTPELRGGMENGPLPPPSPYQSYQRPPPPPTQSGSTADMATEATTPKTPGPKTPGPKTPASVPTSMSKPMKLKPFVRPRSRFVPGPAIFPMAETLLQQVAMSNELERVLYPTPKLNFLQKIFKFYNALTEVRDRPIPLLPPLAEHQIPRSNPRKRKIPGNQIVPPAKKRKPDDAEDPFEPTTGRKPKSVKWAPETTSATGESEPITKVGADQYSYTQRVRQLEIKLAETQQTLRQEREKASRDSRRRPAGQEGQAGGSSSQATQATQATQQSAGSDPAPDPELEKVQDVNAMISGDFPVGWFAFGTFESGRWGAFRAIAQSLRTQYSGATPAPRWMPTAELLNAAFLDTNRPSWGQPSPDHLLRNLLMDINSALQFYLHADAGYSGAGYDVQLGIIFENTRAILMPSNGGATKDTFRVWIYYGDRCDRLHPVVPPLHLE